MKKLGLIAILLLFAASQLKAQVEIEDAKAKFIYNFTKFFEWPAHVRTGDFVIGVLGSGDMYNALNSFTQGKKVITQNISVKKFRNKEDVTECDILYVSYTKIGDIQGIHEKAGRSVLLISDSDQGIQKGAAINFFLEGNRLRYEFKGTNALKYGLKYHSKIAEMAAKTY
ncbi:MAG: YfiR family protein [Bacteroidales bacterium]